MKKLFGIALFTILLMAGVTCAKAETTIEKIKSTGVLTVGVDEDNPPFSFYNRQKNGNLDGFDPEFASAIAAKLGAKAKFVPIGRTDGIGKLLNGEIDVLAGNQVADESLGKLINFSDVYVTTGQGFLAKKGTVKSLGDLIGQKVGTILGTPSEICARNACSGGIIVPFDDYGKALDALQSGSIAAFTSDESILVDLSPLLPPGEYEIPAFMISNIEYVFGLPKSDAEFTKLVNSVIADMNAKKETQRLKEKWFSLPVDRPQVAYGAIVRKAMAEPRFLAITLNGIFYKDAEVSIYSNDGTFAGKGTIVSSIGDEFYLDVDKAVYNQIKSGFLITLNINNEMAKNVLIQQQKALQNIKVTLEEEEARADAQAIKEDAEKAKRAQELEMMRKQNSMQIDLERERYRQLYRYLRRYNDLNR